MLSTLRTAVTRHLGNSNPFRRDPPRVEDDMSADVHESNDTDSITSRSSWVLIGETEDERERARVKEEEMRLREEERRRDTIKELGDVSYHDPLDADKHDELMKQFFRIDYRGLLAEFPARQMHVVAWDAYLFSQDPVVEHVRPRLCDAVATILFETDHVCLDDFLSPNTRVFEWRHVVEVPSRKLSVVIRREKDIVIVGAYRNHGFKHLWEYLIESRIDETGKWLETYASTGGWSPVNNAGPRLSDYVALDSEHDEMHNDPKFALRTGRQFGFCLLADKVWEFQPGMDTVEWECDGVVTPMDAAKATQTAGIMDAADATDGTFFYVG